MRLMRLIFLRRLLPRPLRRRMRSRWNRLLRWEQHGREKKFYRQFIRPGDLVFDVGANVGFKTAAFLSLGARVVAVEPNPVCVVEIKKTNQRAILRGKLKVEALAVADSRGEINLRTFAGDSELTSGSVEFVQYAQSVGRVGGNLITVPATTLDDLIDRHGLPEFLKVDVEGMDAEALTALNQKPKFLSFEYHMRSPVWETTLRCLNEADRLGFAAANITQFASPKFLLPDWIDIKSAASKIRQLFGDSDHWGDVIVK